MKPDAIRYALHILEREWGSYGYRVEKLDGPAWRGDVVALFVCHSDGSRFVIVANETTGRYGHADGHSADAISAASAQMYEEPSCQHGRTQQISEYDVRCLDCGVVSA